MSNDVKSFASSFSDTSHYLVPVFAAAVSDLEEEFLMPDMPINGYLLAVTTQVILQPPRGGACEK